MREAHLKGAEHDTTIINFSFCADEVGPKFLLTSLLCKPHKRTPERSPTGTQYKRINEKIQSQPKSWKLSWRKI